PLFRTTETEDTSMAMLEWPNKALGTMFVSTAQAGEAERLEIAGTKGILRLSRGGLELFELSEELHGFLETSPEPFAKPALTPVPVDLDQGSGDHQAIYENLLAALSDGAAPVADGAEGRKS